jgi:hypothetical protein
MGLPAYRGPIGQAGATAVDTVKDLVVCESAQTIERGGGLVARIGRRNRTNHAGCGA